MAYRDDVDALNPSHRIDFNGDVLDQIGSADGTTASFDYPSTPGCKDVTQSGRSNSTTDVVALPNASAINNSAQDRKGVGGWFRFTSVQGPPKMIYMDGNTTLCFQFFSFMGNNVMLEVAGPSFDVQIYGPVLVPNRWYHLWGGFFGTAYGDEVIFEVDGVPMTLASPANRSHGAATLSARGVAYFGNPGSTEGVGKVDLISNGPVNGEYNEWAWWDGVSALMTTATRRVELFEKGAIGENTIPSGTQGAMQTTLNAFSDTVGGNVTCEFEIQPVIGDGDLSLDLDNYTFDNLTSIHVKYLGTGTLTLININGSNALQAKCSAPQGVVIVSNPSTLTVVGLIDGCEIRVYDDNGVDINDFGDELAGTESLSGTTFEYQHEGVVNNIVIQMLALGYEEVRLRRNLNSTNQTVLVVPLEDNNI